MRSCLARSSDALRPSGAGPADPGERGWPAFMPECPLCPRPTTRGHPNPASRYRTRLPATATFRLAPRPTMGDLDARVGGLHQVIGDPLPLVTQQHDRPLASRLDQVKRRGAFRQLHRHDPPAGRPLIGDPALLAAGKPVDARAPAGAQRVTDGQRLPVVGRARHRDARADRVARAQEGAQVRAVGHPQRRDDQMVPAPVLPCAPAPTQVPATGLGRAQRTGTAVLSSVIRWRACGGARPSEFSWATRYRNGNCDQGARQNRHHGSPSRAESSLIVISR